MPFVFGLFFLLAYLVRAAVQWGLYGGSGCYSVFRKCTEILQRLANHSFGELYRTGRRRLIYQTTNRDLEVQITCQSICRMNPINRAFPFTATFVRLPRMIYAFAESFLSSNQRLDDTGYIVHASSVQTVTDLKTKPGFVSIMRQLGHFGVSIRFERNYAILWKPVRKEELTEESFTRLFALLKDLADICAKEPIDIPVQPLNSEKRCAYCKEQVNGQESLRYCTHCGTPHHTDCFELNGGCTTYGCSEVFQKNQYDNTLRA